MGLIKGIAKLAGESTRIKRTANNEAQLSPEQKEVLADIRNRANNGDLESMYILATYYYEGKYVEYDPDKACSWWTKAANKGHVDSQYNLGLLYEGDVSSYYYDEHLAGYWLNEAAQNGDRDAARELQKYKYSRIRGKWVKR